MIDLMPLVVVLVAIGFFGAGLLAGMQAERRRWNAVLGPVKNPVGVAATAMRVVSVPPIPAHGFREARPGDFDTAHLRQQYDARKAEGADFATKAYGGDLHPNDKMDQAPTWPVNPPNPGNR